MDPRDAWLAGVITGMVIMALALVPEIFYLRGMRESRPGRGGVAAAYTIK